MDRYLNFHAVFTNHACWPIELIGTEAYSDPGEFEMILLIDAESIDISQWISQLVSFSIQPADQAKREFSAYVIKMRPLNLATTGYRYYYLQTTSWLGLAKHSQHQRIFYQASKHTLPSLLDPCLKPYACAHVEYEPDLTKPLLPSYIVQYQESDVDFLTRLLESIGGFYWIDYGQKQQTLRLGMSTQSYRQQAVTVNPPPSKPTVGCDDLVSLKTTFNTPSQDLAQAQYDYASSHAVKLEATSNADVNQVYHYPANRDLTVRTQQHRQQSHTMQMQSRLVKITLGRWLHIADETVLPVSITHTAKDKGGLPTVEYPSQLSLLPQDWQTQLESHYENTILAIPADSAPYVPRSKLKKKAVRSQDPAFVVGNEATQVETDQYARVRVWFPWDELNPKGEVQRCPWVRVLHAQAGVDLGHFFVPQVGDEVKVMYVNHDPEQPVITNSTYSTNTTLPFDLSANPTTTGIASKKHALALTDEADKETLTCYSGQDFLQTVEGDVSHVVQGSEHIVIEKSELTLLLKGRYQISAKQSITLKAGSSEFVIAPDKITLQSSSVSFTTQNGKSNQPVAFKGAMHQCPKHEPSGKPHQGGPIKQGESHFLVEGNPVALVGHAVKCDGPDDKLAEGLANFYVNGKPVVCKTCKTDHGGKVTEGAGTVSAGGDPSLTGGAASDNQSYAIGVSFHSFVKPQFQVKTHQFTLASIQNGIEVKPRTAVIQSQDEFTRVDYVPGGKYSCSLKPYHRQLDIIAVNNQPQLPSYKALLQAPSSPQPIDKLDDAHCFQCDCLWPMVIHDIRPEDADAKSDQVEAYYQVSEKDIEYFKENGNNVTVFIHGYNVELGEFDQQIAYYETAQEIVEQMPMSGFGATIGAGPQIAAAMVENTPEGVKAYHSNHVATVYRNQQTLQAQANITLPDGYIATDHDGDCYIKDEGVPGGRRYVNGTGSRNWAIHMERNINAATSQFACEKGQDYQQYTRLLHVTWHGNPAVSANYMTAVYDAFAAAPKLAQLLQTLKKAGLKVNVIAHSLGNAVLVKALDSLGESQSGVVEHAFLWEPAIPNDVFTREPLHKATPSDDFPHIDWSMRNAIKAAKKYTVLYSQNDNIIGPIPASQPAGLTQQAVNESKPLPELVLAYLVTDMGFTSLYHIGMWLGVPVTYLLHDANQEKLYANWYETVDDIYKAPLNLDEDQKAQQAAQTTHFLFPTLQEQMRYDIQLNEDQYDELKLALRDNINRLKKIFNAAGWGTKSKLKQRLYDTSMDIAQTLLWVPNWFERLLSWLIRLEVGTDAVDDIVDLCWSDARPTIQGAQCLIRMMQRAKVEPKPGMGAVGLDPGFLQSHPHYQQVDQSRWLWSHSGMKIPSDALMKEVYMNTLLDQEKGLAQFGQYELA